MSNRLCALAAAALFLGALPSAVWAGNAMLATTERPAIVTAKAADQALLGAADIGKGHLLIEVAAYTPSPDKKPVEVVVSAKLASGLREIGRFSIMPAAAFNAGSHRPTQNFALPLPDDLKGKPSLELSVAIVPVLNGGQGASVTIANAAIH
jgi:hypothetical protein